MTVYWPVFFGSAAAIFVVLNAVFALLYSLGDEPVANAGTRNPLELFYFSIETLATVGYGDMHPQTNYGHMIATVEIFTGMCFLAVLTGLVFARFSRPRARFVFADYPVVTTHEGRPTLMIRMANARHNTISRANARLWLIRAERTAEGDELRRFYELALDRSDHPMFVLSWMLFHVIDKNSPLHGITQADFERATACWCSMSAASTTVRRSRFMPATSIRGTTSAGAIAIATSPASRRTAAFCSITPSSTTWCRRSNPSRQYQPCAFLRAPPGSLPCLRNKRSPLPGRP